MPDPHTEKIKFERELMLATGKTRGQIREGLQAIARADNQARRDNQVPPPVSRNLPSAGAPAELKPMPFVDQGATRKGGPGGGGASGTEQELYVVVNGTLYLGTFLLSETLTPA